MAARAGSEPRYREASGVAEQHPHVPLYTVGGAPGPTPIRVPVPEGTHRPFRSAGRSRVVDPDAAPDRAPDQRSTPRSLCGADGSGPGRPTTLPHDSKPESFVCSLGRPAGTEGSAAGGHLPAGVRPRAAGFPKPDRKGLCPAPVVGASGGGGGGAPARIVLRSAGMPGSTAPGWWS